MTSDLASALQGAPLVQRLVVALSGGRDSVSLLHALVHRKQGLPLQAVHVHHGLQAAADRFASHCEALCAQWQIPFTLCRVKVDRSGAGLEADARRARYAALEAATSGDAALVTAHHAGDQAETVLMRILRGTGPDGLAGMRVLGTTSGGTTLWRPWLTVTPHSIATYADTNGLTWVEDPHNEDLAFTRVWLRRQLIPQIETRFPAAQAALVRLAGLAAAAQVGDAVVVRVRHSPWGDYWPIDEAAQLAAGARTEALRAWLRQQLGQAPSADMLARIEREVIGAGQGRQPALRINGRTLRRYRQGLYCTVDLPPLALQAWQGTAEVSVPGWGDFSAQAAPAVPLTIRAARPGERIRPAGASQHCRLATLMQARGVPPWLRDRIPVLVQGSEVVALADWTVNDSAPPGLRWRAETIGSASTD